MGEKLSGKERLLWFFRLQTERDAARTVLGGILGALFFIALYAVDLPSYKLMGVVTVQIDPAIIAIPVAAAFFGPLAGLLAGLLGSVGADALFTQQIVAMGLINLSYGLLGFIAGIPHYPKGLSTGRALAKFALFTMAGFSVMALVYLGALILVAGQNMLPTLLYNFLPFFTVSLISLAIVAPVAVRILDAIPWHTFRKAPQLLEPPPP
jgi:uncharacterized membrane protein